MTFMNVIMGQNKREVASTGTTLEIIEALFARGSAGVTELADVLDLEKSTVYYHLQTLDNRGYMVVNDGRYELSLKFLKLGERVRRSQLVYDIGRPEVERLAKETGTNGYLMVEQNNLGILLYTRKEEDINLGDTVGQPICLTSTAGGKSILAGLSDERVETILDQQGLPKMTENTITDESMLYEELEDVREQGYAINKGEQVTGLRAIGTPIKGPDGVVYGAISIAGPRQVMRGDRFANELPEKVLSAANVVELKLIEQVPES